MKVVASVSLLAASFVANGLVEDGVYTAPEGPIRLSDFNVHLENTGVLPGVVQDLPDVGDATLNLSTGVVSGVTGTTDNVSKVLRLVQEIQKLHNVLVNQNNTINMVVTFTVSAE